MRLVDADALMATLGITDMDCNKCAWRDKEWSRCKRGSDFEDACCAIENAPTIEERKTGKWINNIHDIPICDQCGYMTPYDAIDDYAYGNYCPNCGAKMERKQP